MPEDLTVAARNQLGLHARTVGWLELGRGLNRERIDSEGRTVCHVTDETTSRALWRHYRAVMRRKTVVLVNAAAPLPNLSFLI